MLLRDFLVEPIELTIIFNSATHSSYNGATLCSGSISVSIIISSSFRHFNGNIPLFFVIFVTKMLFFAKNSGTAPGAVPFFLSQSTVSYPQKRIASLANSVVGSTKGPSASSAAATIGSSVQPRMK